MVLIKPTVINKYLHVTQDGYSGVTHYIANRRGNKPRKMTIHVMEGSMWGSWTWHHQVSASATVFISKKGVIWNVVPEQHGPWTNGDVNNPDAEIRGFMKQYGSDPNEWTLTIENEGFTGNLPYSTEQAEANVWQLVTWCRTYGLTANDIIRHGQINSVDRNYCPEGPPYTFTNWLKKRVAEELRGVVTPTFNKGDTLEVTESLNVREGAGTKYKIVKTLAVGEKVTVIGDDTGRHVTDADGYTWYGVKFSDGTGWAAGDWLKKSSSTKPVPTPDPVTFAAPVEIPGMTTLHEFVKQVGHPITVLDAKVKTVRKTPRYQAGGSDARIGLDIPAGSTFDVMAEYTSGSTKWYITPYWTRVKADDVEKV